MEKHVARSIDKALNFVNEIFVKASEKIEKLNPGEKIIATGLANEIAQEMNLTDQQVYHILRVLLPNYEGINAKRGAHGGIFKLAVTSDIDESNENSNVIRIDSKAIIANQDNEIAKAV